MQTPRRDLWTPLAGFAAALTFVVGVANVANSPDSDDSNAKVLAWYAKHSHRVGVIVGVFVLMFFGLFLLWFAAGLRERLRAAEGPGGRLANVSFAGAILCVGLIWVGAFALAAVPAGISLGGEPAVTSADVARFVPQLGFGAILVGGMFGAIALIEAASIVIYRTGVLPRWLAWLGFLCAVALLFGSVFLPIIALPIWLIATGVVLLRLPTTEAEPTAPPVAPPT
jgi:hypothetical protein